MGRRRRASLLVASLFLLAACGQQETPETTATTEPSPGAPEAPEPQVLPTGGPTGRALLPGIYTSGRFEPKVTFTLEDQPGARWRADGDLTDILSISKGNAFLSFLRPAQVIDPRTQETVDPPSDYIEWLRNHPNLEAGDPTPTSIGGLDGIQLDIAGITPVEGQRCGIGGDDPPCVAIAPMSEGAPFIFAEGTVARITVLEVDGEAILVAIEDQSETYQDFLPQAEQVLETVEFG